MENSGAAESLKTPEKLPAKKRARDSEDKDDLTPTKAHFKRLDACIEKNGCLGQMLIVGVKAEGDEEEEEEDEGQSSEDGEAEYSEEQMARLRHILINTSRDKALKAAVKFATLGQQDDGMCMFNTHSGNQIIFGIPGEVRKAMKKKSLPERFNTLFALTHSLLEFDFWMHDNECYEERGEAEEAVSKLGEAWRTLLKKKDQDLGIDADYTRPGIEALLRKFADTLSEAQRLDDSGYEFHWQP